jgi:hypothetical protein
MKSSLLMLDGSSKLAYPTIDTVLQIEIKAVRTMGDANMEMESNPGKYFLLISEPDNYLKKPIHLRQYRAFLNSTRNNRHMPVALYSEQPESFLQKQCRFEQGKHYDEYMPKGSIGRVKDIIMKYSAKKP